MIEDPFASGRNRIPEPVRRFIKHIGNKATQKDLHIVTGVSQKTIRAIIGPRDPGRPRYNVDDLKFMFNAWPTTPGIKPRNAAKSDSHDPWTGMQEDQLRKLIGTCPLAIIASDVGRSVESCRKKLRRLNIDLISPVAKLADAIKKPPLWIRNRIEAGQLRSYEENGRLYVHRDDAIWMIYCWRGNNDFPKHPGKTQSGDS